MPCYPILDFAPKLAVHFRDVGGIDLGHSYKAKRQPNGDYTILDLDVFRACQRKNQATGKVDDFSEEWMAGAVQRFDELKRSGYLPPCHLDHHGKDGFSQPPAGQIGALRLGKSKDGVPTLFADIVNVPAEVMAQMLKGRLAYRSVEVNNPDVKEISSLAFMATTVPYHKLPILQLDLDEAPSTFSAASSNRVLFAELYSVDPKQPHRAIVQKFYGEYGPWNAPTAMQNRMGQGGDWRRQGDDGDDDQDDVQISDDDIAQLLPYLQAQQQQGGGQMGGGNHQQMPSEMQGDPMEEMMGNPDGIALLQQLVQQNASISKGVEAILKGSANTSPAPITPNPVTNAESKKGPMTFAENGQQSPASQGDLAGRLAAAEAVIKNMQDIITSHDSEIGSLFMAEKKREMKAHFKAVCAPHYASFFNELVSTARFTEENADKYVFGIEKRFNERMESVIDSWLPIAISKDQKANDWKKLDVAEFFASEKQNVQAFVETAKQNFSEGVKQPAPAAVAQGTTAAPRSTSEAAKTTAQASDADVTKFLESIPASDKNFIGSVFSEKGEEAKAALALARNAWNGMSASQREFNGNFGEYASKMILAASRNGSAAVHG